MRTGAREEYQRKAPHLFPAHRVHPVEAVESLLPELRAHPLYVTIDVDVLDPSEAPGTGAPEPCGITAAELVEIVRLLEPCRIVGTDLMEVAHAWDPSGRTGITASWILREAILTWWGDVMPSQRPILRPPVLRDRLRHEPAAGGELPRPLLPPLRAAAGPDGARHRLRHRPAPHPPGRARLRHVGARSLAREHRLPHASGPPAKGFEADLLVADMTRFRLRRPVDAAICMQDSQGHLLTNEALLAHLRCVARGLKKGGLYVFDRYMCSSWTDPARRWSWTRRRGSATVRATFEALKDLNPVTQTFFEDMELEAHENGVAPGLSPAPRLADGLPAGAARPWSSSPAGSRWSSGSTASSPTSASTRPTIRC